MAATALKIADSKRKSRNRKTGIVQTAKATKWGAKYYL